MRRLRCRASDLTRNIETGGCEWEEVAQGKVLFVGSQLDVACQAQ